MKKQPGWNQTYSIQTWRQYKERLCQHWHRSCFTRCGKSQNISHAAACKCWEREWCYENESRLNSPPILLPVVLNKWRHPLGLKKSPLIDDSIFWPWSFLVYASLSCDKWVVGQESGLGSATSSDCNSWLPISSFVKWEGWIRLSLRHLLY